MEVHEKRMEGENCVKKYWKGSIYIFASMTILLIVGIFAMKANYVFAASDPIVFAVNSTEDKEVPMENLIIQQE